VNTGAPWPSVTEARERVLKIQTKLHRWATDDPDRRFVDLYNLVCDPAFLLVAWDRVRNNKGARSAGVDGQTARSIETGRGVGTFLSDLRDDLKSRTFTPQPVRERAIPKPGTTKRRVLGIPTARDRTVQAALKLVLEPVFEADFKPCSYGFRPRRRAHDAIAETHLLCSHSYEWVVEGDIEGCFDHISHPALLARVRRRIGDKRVVALVKAFLNAGVLSEDGVERDTTTGTPQGGILSPLLANIALSVLDEHFAEAWEAMGKTASTRYDRRRRGLSTYRLVRYADDFVVVVAGTREHAEEVRVQVGQALAPMGLRLSEDKTRIVHIDEGFDFLGFRIRRHRKRGSEKRYVYTYPSRAALQAVKDKVRALTRGGTNQPLSALLPRINRVLGGWAHYFQHGVSKATFDYLRAFTWHRVVGWLRRKHRRSWKWLRRRYLPGWWPTDGRVTLFNPASVAVTRYRYRGTRIPLPWSSGLEGSLA